MDDVDTWAGRKTTLAPVRDYKRGDRIRFEEIKIKSSAAYSRHHESTVASLRDHEEFKNCYKNVK